jgi:hypothetical protein
VDLLNVFEMMYPIAYHNALKKQVFIPSLYTYPFPLHFVFSSLRDLHGLLRQGQLDERCLYTLETPKSLVNDKPPVLFSLLPHTFVPDQPNLKAIS